jgi:putative thiamine transport system ATP-binding protein
MSLKLHVDQLSVGQGAAQRVLLQDFSLTCAPGQIITLMGPSGCGKSSLLAAIAGLRQEGLSANYQLHLNDQRIDHLPTSARQIGLLFQDDLLFAHMSVRENLLFACPSGAGITAAQRNAKTDAALSELGFELEAHRSPLTLSGGQRARVSLMRTLLAEPKALLLDEPFSKLDMALREQFREFVFSHARKLNLPTLLVTHDAADVADARDVIQFNPHA